MYIWTGALEATSWTSLEDMTLLVREKSEASMSPADAIRATLFNVKCGKLAVNAVAMPPPIESPAICARSHLTCCIKSASCVVYKLTSYGSHGASE